MHKEELIAHLAKKHRRPQDYYRVALRDILEATQHFLSQGKAVHFMGFGSFYTRVKKAGKGFNFKTKKPVEYKAVRQAAFHAGDLLKKAVRKKK